MAVMKFLDAINRVGCVRVWADVGISGFGVSRTWKV